MMALPKVFVVEQQQPSSMKWTVQYHPKGCELSVRPSYKGECSNTNPNTGVCTVVFNTLDVATQYAEGIMPKLSALPK